MFTFQNGLDRKDVIFVACVAGVRRGRKEKRRAREAREDQTREFLLPPTGVPSPSRAHFDFPPILRPATQAMIFIVVLTTLKERKELSVEVKN